MCHVKREEAENQSVRTRFLCSLNMPLFKSSFSVYIIQSSSLVTVGYLELDSLMKYMLASHIT